MSLYGDWQLDMTSGTGQVQASFLTQYGLESIATKHVHSFAAGMFANEKAEKPDRLVRLFARLAGILTPERFSSVRTG